VGPRDVCDDREVFRSRAAKATLVAFVGAGAILLATSAHATRRHFVYTHRLVITGSYVDNWTIKDPDTCAVNGSGSVTVHFQFAKPTKVRLYYDKYHGGYSGSIGSWVVGWPVGGGIGDMPSQPAKGTLTLVDNTVWTPDPNGGDCQPPSKADCGQSALRQAKAVIEGHGQHLLVANLSNVSFNQVGGKAARYARCRIGDTYLWDDFGYAGGRATGGDLPMPITSRPRAAKRRVLRVVGSLHKHTAGGCYSESRSASPLRSTSATCTDDVTRKVTATFTRIR